MKSLQLENKHQTCRSSRCESSGKYVSSTLQEMRAAVIQSKETAQNLQMYIITWSPQIHRPAAPVNVHRRIIKYLADTKSPTLTLAGAETASAFTFLMDFPSGDQNNPPGYGRESRRIRSPR